MNKDLLLKEILANPQNFFNLQEMKVLELKIRKETRKGNMNQFVSKKIQYDNDRQYIFTDGSCVNNGKKNSKGGYGVFFGKRDPRNISKRFDKNFKVTNNKAELTAINECLKKLTPLTKYYIVSDSEYSINCVTKWYKSWKIKNWKTGKGTDVLNRELIEEIIKQLENLNVKFIHVNSHMDKPNDKTSMEYKLWYGNTMADYLATKEKN